MKLNIALLLLAVVGASLLCAGCDSDKSGATQQMTTSTKTAPPGTGNMPPAAQKGLENAGAATTTPAPK